MKQLKWFLEGIYLWLFIFIFLSIFQIDKFSIGLENQLILKIYGLILQLAGTVIIILSLGKKLFVIRKHGLIDFITDYFKRFPIPFRTVRKDAVVNVGCATATITGLEARASVEPKLDFENILKYIKEEVIFLEMKMNKENDKIYKEFKQIKTDLISLKENNEVMIEENRRLIRDSSISNIWLDLFGIGLIILGLVLATIPEIIIKYI